MKVLTPAESHVVREKYRKDRCLPPRFGCHDNNTM